MLQVYCVYHCYTKRNHYYWYFAIIFLPAIGCLLYLFTQVFQKRDLDRAQESIVTVLNPTKKISDLEKKFQFSDTFENQVALADAYLEAEFYVKAIENYREALAKGFQTDFYAISKLQQAYYYSSLFSESIVEAEKILDNSKFKKSQAQFLYGMAMEKIGKIDEAEEILKQFDAPFSRYQERLVLAQFYIRNNKPDASKTLLEEMITESENMSKQSRKNTKNIIKKAKEELAALG